MQHADARSRELATNAIHAGGKQLHPERAVVTPIYQSSNYLFAGEDYHQLGYIRLSTTPNHRVLAARIAALEWTESALVLGSGMAAISGTLLSLLGTGDHLLAQGNLYGGTATLLHREFPKWGITHTSIDAQRPDSWAAAVRPATRVVYVETMTNPLLEVADHLEVVEFAKGNGLVSVIDNTFASPVGFRPAEIGYDIVVESCTKFMSGHSDIVAGSVAGSGEHVAAIKHTQDHLGGALDPHAAFLLERGLKTLEVRVREQTRTAGLLARMLEGHAAVSRVYYTGLESHPQHSRASQLFHGHGGMLSLELVGGLEAASRFSAAVEIPTVAVSLGGPESLVIRPAATSHAGLAPEEREASGITDGLIRFSTGLENADDLLDDIDRALRLSQQQG